VYGVFAVLILYMLAPAPANIVLAPVELIYSPNDLTINVLAVGLPSVSKLPVWTLLLFV